MHLKEVQMENFKTFRKKVTVPFYKGFTGVTGPNGSGKSNIADAILFVLGPRSSKMVRAKKLSDLIFHGNDSFKAAKECRVTLIFDNADRVIPVDTDEVSLRRVLRISVTDPNNTLSYFYVNGRSSSQSEFENILVHAHLSAEGYNIVLQGQINEFISKTPQKVREEIDDIAGIRRYDEEIRASLQKKQSTTENMERIGWSLDFIKGRLRELKKEKEEAEKYRDAQVQISKAKATLLSVQRTSIEGELEGYQKAISGSERRKIELRQEMEVLEGERQRNEEESTKVGKEIDEITGEEGRRLKEKMDTAKLEMLRAKDVMASAQEAVVELETEKGSRHHEIKDIKRKSLSLAKEEEKASAEVAKMTEEIGSCRSDIEGIEKELERNDSDILELRRELALASKRVETVRDNRGERLIELDRARASLEAKRTAQADLDQLISTLEYEVKDLSQKLKESSSRSPEEMVKTLQGQFMQARAAEKELGSRMKELDREITALNRTYTQMKLELEANEKLSKGVGMAVDEVLTARDKGEIKGIIGTIGELGNVPEEYSLALEIAAGGRISAVIVEDDEVAANCIERLKRKGRGRATFLPLNKVSSKRPGAKALMIKDDPHVIGLAVDLVKFDARYSGAFNWVFGDTVVVDDLSALRRLMGGVRIVTTHGELAGAGGDITGGSIADRKEGSGFGKRSRRELEGISIKLQGLMAESEQLTVELNEARERANTLEMEIRKQNSEREDRESRLKRTKEGLDSSGTSLSEKKGERAALMEEIASIGAAIGGLETDCVSMEADLKKATEDRDSLQGSLERATPRSMRERLKELRDRLDALSAKRLEQTGIRESSRSQQELFRGRTKELEVRLGEIDAAVLAAKKEMEEAKARHERFEIEWKALETVIMRIDERTKGLYERLNELTRENERVLSQRERARNDIMVQDQVIITQRTNIRVAEEKLSDVMRELQAFKDVELLERPFPTERDLQRKVRELETILENAGNVNLKALEEYEEMDRKRSEIDTELKALEKEKDELEKLISSINEKRRTEFLHVYEAIDKNFRGIYGNISGGGEAFFELEVPEDPLSGGLIIHARPPGKRMTRLGALSGGEKSLTSMAFIFAVQAYDPSTFYLLDEIDQNLDAVNAEIVARMVKQNASFAQFVLISLRKISLKEAHHLYGVTLQKGESVIVGKVDLSEVEAYEKGDGRAVKAPSAEGGAQ